MVNGADGQPCAEILVPARVLVFAKLGLAQGALQVGEEVRDCLGIVPHVRARAVAAAAFVKAALPAPQPPVCLALHGGRLENGQVGGDGFDCFRRQGGVVEAVRKRRRFRAQLVIVRAPVRGDGLDAGERARVPRFVLGRAVACAFVFAFAYAQATFRRIPGQPQADELFRAGGQFKGYV